MGMEELLTTTEKLKEKENSLSSAELEVAALNRRVQGIEGDLETCEDKLLLASQKLDKAATAADDSDRMRKVLESRAIQDEDRMAKLEEELRVVANNLKSLEVSEEKANQREASNKEQIKNLTAKLKQAEARAEFAEKSVQKLQKEVDRLEDELASEQEKFKAITEELEA